MTIEIQQVTDHRPVTIGEKIGQLQAMVDRVSRELYGYDGRIPNADRRRQLEKRISRLEAEIAGLQSLPDPGAVLPRRRWRRAKKGELVVIPVECQCGCGLRAPIATRTDSSRGWIKGRPLRYIRGHQPKRHLHLR